MKRESTIKVGSVQLRFFKGKKTKVEPAKNESTGKETEFRF